MIKNIGYILILLVFSTVFILSAIELTEWLFKPLGFNLFKYVSRSLLLLGSQYFFWKALLKIKDGVRTNFQKNLIALIGASLTTIIFLEIVLSFIPISTGGGPTLASKNWESFYWQENELGYRDESPKVIDEKNKKNIFFIGDSFIAGHGIKNTKNRMTNLLRDRFEHCFDIFNIAKRGADTKEELMFLTSYPIKPDLIIFAHHRNDIERVLSKNEIVDVLKLTKKDKLEVYRYSDNYFFKNSFFLNLINFLIVENSKNRYARKLLTDGSNLENTLSSGPIGNALKLSYYRNDLLLKLHLKDLEDIINYSKQINAPVIFLLFTDLRDVGINTTDEIVNKPITQHLRSLGIPVINIIDVVKSIEEKERIVNRFDSHPSVLFNKEMSDLIEKELKSLGVFDNFCN